MALTEKLNATERNIDYCCKTFQYLDNRIKLIEALTGIIFLELNFCVACSRENCTRSLPSQFPLGNQEFLAAVSLSCVLY